MLSSVPFLVLLALSCVAHAAPGALPATSKTSSSSSAKASPTPLCQEYTTTFDNYTTLPLLPQLSPINFDDGLYFTFNAIEGTLAGAGVIPASSPKVAALAVDQDLTKEGTVTNNPFGVITTNGTATKSFSLISFSYACVVFTDGIPAPTGCGLDVYGYNIFGQRVGSTAFNFAPSNEVDVPMDVAVLPSYYVLLQNVSIGIATSNVTTAVTVLYIDNATHINCH